MKQDFKSEFKKQIRTAIAAAIGFLIAYAWRDFIMQLVAKIMYNFISFNPINSSFIIALFLTFVGVILILISSKLLK